MAEALEGYNTRLCPSIPEIHFDGRPSLSPGIASIFELFFNHFFYIYYPRGVQISIDRKFLPYPTLPYPTERLIAKFRYKCGRVFGLPIKSGRNTE